MYEEHEVFEKPDNENIKIWRFVDFQKFVSLLNTKSLYFNRADLFEDIFEGTYSKATLIALQKSNLDTNWKNAIIQSLQHIEKFQTKGHYLNCWHMNEFESDAMWKLYTNSNGIAIQSTFQRFTQSFKGDKKIYIGIVKYIDYNKESISLNKKFINAYDVITHKRLSYRHEQELRAVTSIYPKKWNENPELFNNNPHGVNIEIDLDELIEKIYVSPRSAKWFQEIVKSVTEKYDLRKPIEFSSLDEKPLFR